MNKELKSNRRRANRVECGQRNGKLYRSGREAEEGQTNEELKRSKNTGKLKTSWKGSKELQIVKEQKMGQVKYELKTRKQWQMKEQAKNCKRLSSYRGAEDEQKSIKSKKS